MMNITTFKAVISPKLHGTTLAKIPGNFYDKMHEAAGQMSAHVRPYSLIRKYQIANAIYDKVYNYAVNSDLEADSVIDIRPIGVRSQQDAVQATGMQQFDIKKGTDTFEVEYINGLKTMRLSKCLTPRTLLFDMDSLSIGATVTGSGDVTGLALDYLDYVSGNASIAFGLSGATGQGKVTIALASSIDLTTLEGQGALFAWLKFPLASALTNVKLRLGTGAGAYYESIVTSAIDGNFASDAWQLLIENLRSATKTGSPNFAAVNWIQVEINYTVGTARTGVKLDNITAALGQAWEVVYYSNCFFTDSTGTTWKETPTTDTDLIQLEGTMAINAFIYAFMLTLQQELKGKNMAADYNFFKAELDGRFGQRGVQITQGLYQMLNDKYPNQALQRQIEYYHFGELDGN